MGYQSGEASLMLEFKFDALASCGNKTRVGKRVTASMVTAWIMHGKGTDRLYRTVMMYVISSRAGPWIAKAVETRMCLMWFRVKFGWVMQNQIAFDNALVVGDPSATFEHLEATICMPVIVVGRKGHRNSLCLQRPSLKCLS